MSTTETIASSVKPRTSTTSYVQNTRDSDIYSYDRHFRLQNGAAVEIGPKICELRLVPLDHIIYGQ